MELENNGLEEGYKGSVLDTLESDDSGSATPSGPGGAKRPSRRGLSLHYNKTAFLVSVGALSIIVVIAVASFGLSELFSRGQTNPAQSNSSGTVANYAVGTLPLGGIEPAAQLQLGEADYLAINGQLQVNSTLVLNPSSKPATPTVGQIYFDQATKEPYYYNGTQFIGMTPSATPQHVTSLGGVTGVLALGSGLQINGNQLSVSSTILQASANGGTGSAGVTSLQGLTGAILLHAGAGVGISGTTFTNTGVLSLSGTPNQIGVSGGTGNVVLSLPQDIDTNANVQFNSLALTAGDLSLAPAATVHADNLATVNNGDSLTIAGSNNITFTNGNGANSFIFPTSGGLGQVICTTAITCASGGGQAVLLEPTGVQGASANKTAVFINKTGGTGNLIELQDGGADELVIDNTGNTTISKLSVSNGLTVTAGGANITGNSTITGTLGGLTALSSSGTITFSSLNAAGVVHTNPSGQLSTGTVALATETTGNYLASLGSVTGLTAGGTNGVAGGIPTLSVNYGSIASTAVQGNTTLTCASGTGNLTGGGNSITLGTGGSCGNLTITNSPTFSGTLAVQGAGGITVGSTTSSGVVNFLDGTNDGFTASLKAATQTIGSSTITIPNTAGVSDTVCLLTLGNCVGTGGSVSTTGGTQNFITKYNNAGANQLTSSEIFDNGSGVAIGSVTPNGLFNVGASNQFQVGASGAITAPTSVNTINGLIVNAGALSGVAGYTQTSGNFDQSGSTGTFDTGSGAVHLNGDTTIAGLHTLSVGSGLTSLGGGLSVTAGLTTLSGGATVSGATSINTTGTANTSIGNGTGTLTLTSSGLNVSAAGAVTGATAVTASGNINTTAGALQLNGASINTAGTLTNVAYLNQANTFTAAGTALTVNNSASVGNTLTVGAPGTTTGSLILANAANARTVTLQVASQTVGSSTVTIPNTAGVSDTVCLLTLANCAGTGGGLTGSGTAGTIAEFNGTNSLTNSPLSDTAGNLSTAGSLTTVGLNSGSGLLQGTGGLTVTGAASINATGTANTSIGNSTGTFALASSGLNVSTAGALTGVTSLTLSGSISGGTSFTGSGNINTTAGAFQLNGTSINTAGTLTNVAYLNQANNFTAATNQFSAAGTALSVTNNASIGNTLTLGNPGTAAGTLSLANGSSSRVVNIQGLNPSGTGNATIQFPSVAGGNTDTVCLVALGNCAGSGGGITGSGTAGTIAEFNGTGSLTNSPLTDVSGNLTASGNVAIQGSGGLTIGVAGTTTGNLTLTSGANSRTVSLQIASQTVGNSTITIPNTAGVSDTVCLLTLANCVGTGGGITGSGTAGTIAEFNGTGSLTNSPLTDVSGNLSTTGSLTGVGLNSGSGLLQGTGGLTLTGTTSINASGSGNTNINTGTNTGNVAIGNSTGTFAVTSAALNITAAGAVTEAGALTVNNAGHFNTNSTTALNVEQTGVHNNVLTVDTTNGAVGINQAPGAGVGLSVTGSIVGTNTIQGANLTINVGNTADGLNKNYTVGTGGVNINDVVVLANDGGNSRAIDTTTSHDIRVMGVAFATATSGNPDAIVIAGNTQVTADTAAVAIGDQLVTSATSGEVTVDNNATTGILGYATTTKIGGVSALVGVYVHPVNGTTNPVIPGNLTVQGTGSSSFAGNLAVSGSTGLTVGNPGSTTGNLILANAANARTVTIQAASQSVGSSTVTIPDTAGVSDTVCLLTLANCSGGTVGGSGTTGTIAEFNGTHSLTNSPLTDSGGNLSTAGSLAAVGLSSGSGLLQGTGGLTLTGTTLLNTTGTANTSIGNSTGTFALTSPGLNVSTAGVLSGITGYTQSSGTFAQTFSSGANNAVAASWTVTNSNAGATSTTVNAQSIALVGHANANPGANTIDGLNFANVTPISNNTFNGLYFGTGYDSLLNYNGTPLINGTGILQSAAVSGAYANLTGTGALSSGSIASGFGIISTGNNITTTAALQGGTLNIASGAFTVDGTGNLATTGAGNIQGALTLGNPGTTTGSLILGNSANARTITIQAASQTVGSSTVTIPNTAGVSDTVCLLTLANCAGGSIGGSGTAGTIPVFATSTSLGNSVLSQSGTVLTAAASTLFKNPSDLTTAFQVQNVAGNDLLAVDTSGSIVNLGSTGSTALASTVNVATSTGAVQTLNLGSTNGASATTLQGGTGNVAINTGAGSGTTGSISLATGNSSAGVSGNVSIDAGTNVLPATQIADKTFESTVAADNFTATDNAAVTTAAPAHLGSKSLQITVGGTGGWGVSDATPYTINTVVAGHTYRFSAWIKAATTGDAEIFDAEFSNDGFSGGGSEGDFVWATATDTTGGFTQVTGTLAAPAGSSFVGVGISSAGGVNGEVHNVDDITVTDITSGGSALNFGTTNAQSVKLGNANQTGATTLQGGFAGTNILAGSGGQITLQTTGLQSGGVSEILSPNGDYVITLTPMTTGTNNEGGGFAIQDPTGDELFTANVTDDDVGLGSGSNTGFTGIQGGEIDLVAGNSGGHSGDIDLTVDGDINLAGGGATSNFNIGSTGATTGAIKIGGTGNSTGTITIGQSTGNQTINIADAVVASGKTSTINIGSNASNAGKVTATLGSLATTSTTTIQGGSDSVAIDLSTAATGGTTITAAAPVSVAGSGTAAGATLTVAAAAGGASSGTTSQTGGTGGGVSLTTGAGGAVTGASGTETAGAGGAFSLQGGNGGNATSGVGGAGAALTLQAGNGGTSTGTNVNANGGNITLSAGSAGSGGSGTAGTIGSVIVKNQSNSTTAFQVQNTSGNQEFTVDTTGNQVVLGKAGTLTAGLAFATASGGILTVSPTSQASNFTLTLPAETGTICTTASSGACSTAGTGFVQLAPAAAQTDGTTNSSVFINKTGASGNLLELQKSSVDAFTVSNTGNLTLGTGSDKTISVATQTTSNAAGNNLTVQSATGNGTGAGGAATLQGGTSGAGATGNGGAVNVTGGTASSTAGVGGQVTVQGGTSTGANAGGLVQINGGTAGATGAGGAVTIQAAAGGATSGNGGAVTIKSGAGTASGANAGAVTIDTGAPNGAGVALLNLGNTNAKTITLGNQANSTVNIQGNNSSAAVQLQASNGGTILIGNVTSSSVNTISIGSTGANPNADAVSINTAAANDGSFTVGGTGNDTGSITLGQSTGTNTITVGNGATASGKTQTIQIGTGGVAGSSTAVTIGSTLGTTGDTVKLQGGATVETLANTGDTIQTTTNSSTAFQVQNAIGTPIFNLDSTTDASNLITNADFEQNTTGWSGDGSGGVATSSTAHLYGAQAMAITTTTAAGDGAKYPIALSPNTTYTLDVPIYSTSLISINTLSIGYSDTGVVGGEPDFTNNVTTIGANTWVHAYLGFTTGATVNGGAYVYIKQNGSGTARTFYVDGLDLVQTNGGGSQFHEGNVQLNGTITSPLVVQSPANNNNTAALTVLNSAGQTELAVDTVNNQVLVGTAAGNGKFTVVSGGTQIAGRFVVSGSNTNDNLQVESDNASGTETNGIFFNRNQTGGTTTNGLNITDTAGNLTNGVNITNANGAGTLSSGITLTATNAITTGITFTGAGGFTNLISAPNFIVSNAGVITLQGNQTNDITTAAQGTTNAAGNSLTLGASAGNGTGAGGVLTIQGGTSGSGPTGSGGNVAITAGNAASTNGSGGNIVLTAGNKTGTGTVGGVSIALVGAGSTTAFQIQGASNPILTVDNVGAHIIVGATANCAGPGSGRFCVNQSVLTATSSAVNQNNSTIINDTNGITTYASYFNVSDTTAATANIDNVIYSDAGGTSNASAQVNTIFGKVASGQGGSFLQFQNGSNTVLNVANSGATAFADTGTTAFQIQNASNVNLLNADTSGNILTVATTAGGSLVNDGSTLNTAKSLGNFGSNGAIGTAAATVDIYTTFVIPQTTGSISLTVPNPTNTTAGRIIYIANTGSATLTVAGITLTAGSNMSLLWNGTAWTSTAVSTGVTLVGAFSGSSQANGATISGNTITFGPADATNPGMVSTGTQTFNGSKTFETTTNSTTAFQIQNSGGTSLLSADTTDNLVAVGAGQENASFLDVSGIGGAGVVNNFLVCSEEFDAGNGCGGTSGTDWVYTGIATPTADTVVASNGAQTAEALVGTGNSKAVQSENVSHAATTYTFSVWLKQVSGAATTGLCIYSAAGTPSACTPTAVTPTTTGWQRFFITQAITGSPTSIKVEIHPGNGSTATVDAWGAQLTTGSSEGVYVQTVLTPQTDGVGELVANDGITIAGGNAGFNTEGDLIANIITAEDTTTLNTFVGTHSALDVIQNSSGATSPTAIIQEGATPTATADLLQFQNSTTNPIASVDRAGNFLTAANFDTENNNNLNIGIANATGVTIGNAGINNTTTIQGLAIIQTFAANSATALQVQNGTGHDELTVDTNGNVVAIGQPSTQTATLKFYNSGGANAVGLQAGSATAAYTLTLPTTAPSTTQCLQSGAVTATNLIFGSCSGSGGSLQSAYNTSAGAAPSIDMTSTNKGFTIQNDNSSSITGELFGVHDKTASGLGAGLLTVSNTGQTSIGSVGTATGQLYVSGSVPSAAAGAVVTGNQSDVVAVQGRYAYVASNNGGELQVVDVSNPASPSIVGSLTGFGTGIGALYVQGHYVYMTAGTTLFIVDVSNPHSPTQVGSIFIGLNWSPSDIYVQGNYAYIISNVAGTEEWTVMNVSNPTAPTPTGGGGNLAGATGGPTAVRAEGRYLYITDGSSPGLLQIFDLTNPASPTAVGSSFTVAATGLTAGLSLQGRYAYITDSTNNKLYIVDISNPASPAIVNTGGTTTGTGPMDVYVQGRYAYIINQTAATLQTFDVSNPASPASVGTVSTATTPLGLYVSGRYAYVASGITTSGDFQAFDLGGAYVQQLQVGGVETGTLITSGNASVNGDVSVQGGLAVTSSAIIGGSLTVGGALTGSTFTDTEATTGTHTLIDSTPATGYYLHTNIANAGTSATTDTYNITGVQAVEGAVVFIGSDAVKTSNTGVVTTIVQIGGVQISSVATTATNSSQDVKENYIVMFINSTWRIMGYGNVTSGGAAAGTFDTADYAEWIDYSGSTAPQAGDLLTVGSSDTSVADSSSPYDSHLIGVVSTNPYQVGGADDGHSVVLALAGRVPVKVDLENGPIAPGDPLTSSSTPGVAMKATKPGNIIGTALEAYDGTQQSNEINVQLHLGYDDPTNGQSANQIQGDASVSGSLNVGGDAAVGGNLTVTGSTTTKDLTVTGSSTLADLTVTGDASLQTITVVGTATVGSLEVTGSAHIGGDLTVSGHFITAGNQPTATANTALAGNTATCAVSGNDTSGTITVASAGTGQGAGLQCTVDFSKAFAAAPRPVLTPTNSGSVTAGAYATATATNFTINFANPPAAGQSYTFNYFSPQ